MNLTRREVAKLGLLAAVAPAAFLTGCNLETDILDYAKVGKLAFDNVVALLESRGVIPAGGNNFTRDVDAAFDAVANAVTAFQSGNGTGTLAKISAALAAVTAAIQTFLAATNIPDSQLLSTILALVQIILETIEGFIDQLPNPPAAVRFTVHSRAGDILIAPKKRSLRQFKRDWNAMAKSHATPQVELPLSFWEKI
jgi:hypothetical protein